MGVTAICLLGGGGHASDLLGVIEAANRQGSQYEVIGIFDDNAHVDRFAGRNVNLFQNIERKPIDLDFDSVSFISALGYPSARLRVARSAEELGMHACAPIIHPGAVYIGTGVSIAPGSIVHAGVSISVKATIGRHCYLSHGCLIGHDSIIDAGVAIMPGASLSGEVTIGQGAMIGTGAVVLESIRIGANAQVGAGAVVTRDVADGETVVGIPARTR